MNIRRIMLYILAAGCLFFVSVFHTYAAVPQKIGDIRDDFASMLSYYELDGAQVDALDNLDVQFGSELRVYLVGENRQPLFFDQNGDGISNANVTLSRMTAAKIAVGAEFFGEADVIESVTLEYTNGSKLIGSGVPYISIQFAETIQTVDDIAFSVQIYLEKDQIVLEQSSFSCWGTLRVPQTNVWGESGSVNLAGGKVAVAEEDTFARVNLGYGVTILAEMAQGERYYGTVTKETLAYDFGGESIGLFAYSLQTVNLDAVTSSVILDTGNLMFVYSEDGEYLGTTKQQFPYFSVYYVTDHRLDSLKL